MQPGSLRPAKASGMHETHSPAGIRHWRMKDKNRTLRSRQREGRAGGMTEGGGPRLRQGYGGQEKEGRVPSTSLRTS